MNDNTLKLYQSSGSPNLRRVRIFLAEKGLEIPSTDTAIRNTSTGLKGRAIAGPTTTIRSRRWPSAANSG
jgi:hypothetical protein